MKKSFLNKCKKISQKTAGGLSKRQITRDNLHFITQMMNKSWDYDVGYNDSRTQMKYIMVFKDTYPPHRYQYFIYQTQKGLLVQENDRTSMSADYYLYEM